MANGTRHTAIYTTWPKAEGRRHKVEVQRFGNTGGHRGPPYLLNGLSRAKIVVGSATVPTKGFYLVP